MHYELPNVSELFLRHPCRVELVGMHEAQGYVAALLTLG